MKLNSFEFKQKSASGCPYGFSVSIEKKERQLEDIKSNNFGDCYRKHALFLTNALTIR